MLRTALFAASLVLAAPLAQAQTIMTPPVEHLSNDVVVLKDGTTLHGAVREMTPNQSLTIALENGQSRVIEWKDIERVDIDRAKAAPVALASSTKTTTMVHVDGPPNVFIQTLDAHEAGNGWVEVCRGACDRELPSTGIYRIAGSGMRTSHVFRIDNQERVRLGVTPASSAGFIGGLVLAIIGGALLLNGVSFLVVASVDKNLITQNTYDTFIAVGLTLVGVGAVADIVGTLILVNNLHTEVSGTTRRPAWSEFPAQPSSRFGAVTFPVLSGSF